MQQNTNSSCVFLVLDGLGDRSFTEFENLTPLQKAHTPNLDKLATLGGNGLYHAAIPGQALPSELAHFSLFGYAQEDFPGRGLLEALGGDLEPEYADIALMARLVSLNEADGELFLYKDRPEAKTKQILELSNKIKSYEDRNIQVDLQIIEKTFGVLILKGEVSPYITDSDPMQENHPLSLIRPWEDYNQDPSTQKTCSVLNSYLVHCYETLHSEKINNSRKLSGKTPINGLVTQRAGQRTRVRDFGEKWGLSAISVSSGTLYRGISRFLGLDFSDSPEHTDPEIEISRKLEEAYCFLNSYDLIHVHTKWPDKAAHSKDPEKKKMVIEGLDRGIGQVIDYFLADPNILLLVTADHSTPSAGTMLHCGEPVPLTFCGPGIRRDNINKYDEVSVSNGSLGWLKGREIMYSVLNYLDKGKLVGTRDAPADNPYMSKSSPPLRLSEYKK